MLLTRHDNVIKQSTIYTLEISHQELMSIYEKLTPLEKFLLGNTDNNQSVADKVLALATICHNIERMALREQLAK